MSIKTIAWTTGGRDNIYIDMGDGTGDETLSITSDPNTGAARSKTINVITGNLVRNIIVNQEGINTKTSLYPSSYNGLIGTITNASNGYEPYTSNTYALISATSGNREVKFIFDSPTIPSNVTITSVELVVTFRIMGSGRNIQLYSSDTRKLSQTVSGTNKMTLTFDLSSWSISELANVRIRLHSNNGNLYFYGATLTINWQ